MEKPNIIIDVDDTLIESGLLAKKYVEKKYSIKISEADLLSTNEFCDIVNKYRKEKISFYDFYLDYTKNFTASLEWHDGIKLLPGVLQVIPELSREYTLWLCTARNKEGLNVLYDILHRQYNLWNYFKGTHFVFETDRKTNKFSKIPKREFIESLSGQSIALVDDSIRECNEANDLVSTFLFDPAGLKTQKGSRTIRSWFEFANIFIGSDF